MHAYETGDNHVETVTEVTLVDDAFVRGCPTITEERRDSREDVVRGPAKDADLLEDEHLVDGKRPLGAGLERP